MKAFDSKVRGLDRAINAAVATGKRQEARRSNHSNVVIDRNGGWVDADR